MNISIRPIELGDLSAMIDIFTNKDVFSHFDEGPWPKAKIEASVTKNVQRWNNGTTGSHVICQNNRVVGRMAVYPNSEGEHELGYVLNQKVWGQGIAQNAARLGLAYIRKATQARHVIAFARASNLASIKVLSHTGFKETSRTLGKDDIMRIKYRISITR